MRYTIEAQLEWLEKNILVPAGFTIEQFWEHYRGDLDTPLADLPRVQWHVGYLSACEEFLLEGSDCRDIREWLLEQDDEDDVLHEGAPGASLKGDKYGKRAQD